jgi:PEP-CTERM motif
MASITMSKPKSVGKFARNLISTTLLMAVFGAAALAGPLVYTEGQGGLPADFPNSGPGTALAAQFDGTTIVNGTLLTPPPTPSLDNVDWFELTGVGTGTFTVGSTTTNADIVNVFADTNLVAPLETGDGPVNFGAIPIPGDGNVVFEVTVNPAGNTDEGPDSYSITLNAIPEPSTVMTLGLGLAGILTLARKRKRQSQA